MSVHNLAYRTIWNNRCSLAIEQGKHGGLPVPNCGLTVTLIHR
jgi:hypothetical protein